ncbi:MAG: peptidoglycan DD-metalloendopeptidase family protein [Polyangiaceae bacterium]
MKRTTSLVIALCVAGAGGAALGVPRAPTAALDHLADKKAKDAKPAPIEVPSNPYEVEIALKKLDTEEKDLLDDQARTEHDLTQVEARLLARGRTYYKHVHAGLLPAGGGFEELVDHAARVERTRLSLNRDLESQKNLRAHRDEIEERLLRIGAERAPLIAQKKAFDSAKAMMRQADERRAAFDRAFSSSTPPPDSVTIYGAENGPPSDAPSEARGFEALFGKLPMPISGRAEISKIPASGAQGPALELKTTAASTARAVAPGRVVFADRYEDQQITVVLDHGDRHFTVYANLADTTVQAGDVVRTGLALGNVAVTSGEYRMYFELRKEGRAVEPGPWFGL